LGILGWGNHTSEFVDAVDAVERARGKRPPVFADIRISRSVRAPGFRDNAFKETVGKNRYRWLRKLGNSQIKSGRRGIKIADPTGVDDLLQLIAETDKQRRRVIFFCNCKSACDCHRAEVARLLVNSASRKGIPLSVAEWPGEEPRTVELAVSESVVNNVLRDGGRVPLDGLSLKDLHKLAALPWGSRVGLCSDDRDIAIVSGPAQLGTHWYLPVLNPDRSEGDRYDRKPQEGGSQIAEGAGLYANNEPHLEGPEAERENLRDWIKEQLDDGAAPEVVHLSQVTRLTCGTNEARSVRERARHTSTAV
jgi:hypothetical protein